MIKLDHFTIFVSNYAASREWYIANLGLRVAFDDTERGVSGLEDDAGVELILVQRELPSRERDCVLTFQCASVEARFRELTARGVTFAHGPQAVFWGYGAELRDPDGYPARLWDAATMPG